jgi:hypothetical protein
VKFRRRRERQETAALPDVRRATDGLVERIRDLDQVLGAFAVSVIGTADRMREMTIDAERQVEAHDERNA